MGGPNVCSLQVCLESGRKLLKYAGVGMDQKKKSKYSCFETYILSVLLQR